MPEVINFDGVSKIHLVDPNNNINYSFNQLKNYFSDYKNILKFQTGISNKTKIQKYYESRISTASTFALNNKKSKKYSKYYNLKPKKQIIYSFKDFLKINKLSKPDAIKIDVEGLEISVLNSVLSCSDPFLVQIEANINNPIFAESFASINKIMNKKNYFLYTLFPSYGDLNLTSKNNSANMDVNLNDIETNFNKRYLLQSECYYVKKVSNYSMKNFVLVSGFGLSSLFIEKLKSNKKLKFKQKKILKKIYNIIK